MFKVLHKSSYFIYILLWYTAQNTAEMIGYFFIIHDYGMVQQIHVINQASTVRNYNKQTYEWKRTTKDGPFTQKTENINVKKKKKKREPTRIAQLIKFLNVYKNEPKNLSKTMKGNSHTKVERYAKELRG